MTDDSDRRIIIQGAPLRDERAEGPPYLISETSLGVAYRAARLPVLDVEGVLEGGGPACCASVVEARVFEYARRM